MSIRIRIVLGSLVAVVLAGAAPLYALDPHRLISQYGMRTWQIADGLPDSNAGAIAQDGRGYLWVASGEGLVRFDGARFVKLDEHNTPELKSLDIHALAVDVAGELWVATADGLLRRHGGRFIRYTTRDGLPVNWIVDVAAAPDGSLWIGTDRGLSHYSGGTFQNIGWPGGAAERAVQCILRDHDGTVWIGTRTGLARLRDGRIEDVSFPNNARETFVNALCKTRDGSLWIGTGTGLFRWKGTIERVTNAEVAAVDARALLEDRDGNLWIGTTNAGLLRYRGGRIDGVGVGEGLANRFASPWIFSIFEDRERNLWIGTRGNGLLQMRDTVVLPFGPPEGIPGEAAGSVAEDGHGVIWFGTRQGLTRYDGQTFRTYTKKDGLSRDYIIAVTVDHAGTVWATTPGTGVNFIRGNTIGTLTTRNGLPSNLAFAVVEDALGALWIGTDKGLARRRAGRIETFSAKDGYVKDFIYGMSPAPDGSMYFGIGRGSLTHFRDGRFMRTYLPQGLADARVVCVVADADGTLWIGLDGKGLLRIHGRELTRWTTANGLLDNNVVSLVDDGKGFFWMTSTRGIARVSRRELLEVAAHRIDRVTPRVFGVDDGMRSLECNFGRPGAIVTRDGKIWVPTLRGFVCLDSRRFIRPGVPTAARIETVTAEGTAAPGPPWRLGADAHRIEIAYTAFQFTMPAAVRFRTMLDGVDEGWVDVGARRTAFYTKLPPGAHTFHVMASTDGATWSSAAVATIVQAPRFYQTWWFALLVAGAAFALLWSGYTWRVAALRRQRKRLTRLVQVRTAELQTAKEAAETVAAVNVELSGKNRLILDSAADGILGVDRANAITFINHAGARILGWEAESIVGQPLHPLVHPDESQPDCTICHPLSSETRSASPVLFRSRDGRMTPVDVTVSAMPNRRGAVVTFRDATERVAIEQMKNEYLATVSHELRTPLTGIRGALGLVSGPMAGSLGAKAQGLLQMAVRNCDRLLRLVNELLDSERLVSGRIELQRDEVDAATLMQRAVELMQPMAEPGGVQIEAEPLAQAICVDGDRIVQLLTNLVGNAVKFSPSGGVVRLFGEVAEDSVLFHVQDQGRGIPSDKLGAVFERFRQVESADALQKGGSGLGLAICRGIAEAHGGRIWVESQVGVGSTFSVSLPLALNQAALAVSS